MPGTKRPPQAGCKSVDLFIRRKDGTEVHHVRQDKTEATFTAAPRLAASDEHDETYQIVMECAPYTASFNALLSRSAANEDAKQLVSLVHHRMHSEGIPLNSQTYNLLMKRLVQFTDGSIFALYEELKQEGRKTNTSVQPNLDTFVLLFRACERGAQYGKTFVLYQQMREYFDLVPDTPMYNALLGYCAAARDVAQAGFLVEEMKQLDVPRDVNTYNCLMSVMVNSAPYEEIMSVFQELLSLNIKPTVRSYNTILKATCQHGDYDRAFQLTEEMKRRGLVPDVETYNYLMTVCHQRLDYVHGTGAYAAEQRRHAQVVQGRRSVVDLVLTLLREMRSMRVQPNTYTYNMALATLAACADERVFDVYDEMVCDANALRNAKSEADAPVAGRRKKRAQFSDHASAGAQLEMALQAEEKDEMGNIRSRSVQPNLETWKEVTRACLHFGYVSRARQLYLNMKAVSLTVNASLALLLLQVCVLAKDRVWAQELLDETKYANILLDTALMNAHLQLLCAVDMKEKLFTEYDQMRLGIHPSGAWADTATCNIVLEYAYTVSGKRAFADDLYATMSQPYSTTPANDETYRVRLEGYAADPSADVDTVLQYAEEVMHAHPTLSSVFYHALFRLLRDRDDARIRTWFDRLGTAEPEHGRITFPVDVTCYTLLMEYYLSRENYTAIQELYAKLQCTPAVEADKGVYRVLLDVAHRQDDVRTTSKLFDHARIHCVELDVLCYNKMLETYVSHDESLVFEVLTYMKERQVAPADSTLAVFLCSANGRKLLTNVIGRDLFYSASAPAALAKLLPAAGNSN